MPIKEIPYKQIRALFTDSTIRVYQAYSDLIADTALENRTFISPPFKMDRMTWIKPSFLWMMYRSGWGKKDNGQKRVLAIDITREGFEWALKHSLLSHKAKKYVEKEKWLKIKNATPVRIQWDPERDIHLQPLEHRSIQIGISKEAVGLYIHEWIQNITDVTKLATEIKSLVDKNEVSEAYALFPKEIEYPVSNELKNHLGIV